MPPARKKAKKPPRTVAANASKSVKFRSRGMHKCTTRDGKSLKGMHSALATAIGAGFNYDAAKKNKTLKAVPHPPVTEFHKRHAHTKNDRRLPYSAIQGKKADTQLTSIVKLHLMPTQQVPLRAFVDVAFRDHWLALKFGKTSVTPLVSKQIKRIRNAANGLLPEIDALLRWMIAKKLEPVSTQDAVASGAVGTQCDLVVKNQDGEYIVCELKTGCETNWTHGRKMPLPFDTLLFTTHREHQLQTLMTARCYRRTYPTRKVGSPLLLRSARDGLHVYAVPPWAKDGEKSLATKMHMT